VNCLSGAIKRFVAGLEGPSRSKAAIERILIREPHCATLVTAYFFFDFRPLYVGVGRFNGLVEPPQCVGIGF
jgi:hypothetical protein